MAKKLMVGEVLDVAAQGEAAPYENYEAEYESLLNGLVTSMGVDPRHDQQGDDTFYALLDVLTGLKDLYDVLDARIDMLEGYH